MIPKILAKLFNSETTREKISRDLYHRLNEAARQPQLYIGYQIPDTLEGRFECVTLHVIIMLRRLRALPSPAQDLAQDLVDAMFKGLDHDLREMGVGDTVLPKRMRTLTEAFYGRARTYDLGLDDYQNNQRMELLSEGLERNIDPAILSKELADYVVSFYKVLLEFDFDKIINTDTSFKMPLPAFQ